MVHLEQQNILNTNIHISMLFARSSSPTQTVHIYSFLFRFLSGEKNNTEKQNGDSAREGSLRRGAGRDQVSYLSVA